eukprot:scaffold3038_cov163-Amphora_coffeaeformis.AAC.1
MDVDKKSFHVHGKTLLGRVIAAHGADTTSRVEPRNCALGLASAFATEKAWRKGPTDNPWSCLPTADRSQSVRNRRGRSHNMGVPSRGSPKESDKASPLDGAEMCAAVFDRT